MKFFAVLLLAALARADLDIDAAAGTITDSDNGITIESFNDHVFIHADNDEVEIEGGEVHIHSVDYFHLEGEGANGWVHLETTGDGNITIESILSDIYVHADNGEVEIEAGEIHLHSVGEIHLEGEADGPIHLENAQGEIFLEAVAGDILAHADAGEIELEAGEIHLHSVGEIHLEGEADGPIHLENAEGDIFLEAVAGDILAHADAGEVELEALEIHLHAPDEIHIEGEAAGEIHIENSGTGNILLETTTGDIEIMTGQGSLTINNGLYRNACEWQPCVPMGVTQVCPLLPLNLFQAGIVIGNVGECSGEPSVDVYAIYCCQLSF